MGFSTWSKVGHEVEDGTDGIGFGGAKEFVHASDDERDAGTIQGLDDGASVTTDTAEQDGEVAVGETTRGAIRPVTVCRTVKEFDFLS